MTELYREKIGGGLSNTITMKFIYREISVERDTGVRDIDQANKIMKKTKSDIDKVLDPKEQTLPKVFFLGQAIKQTYRDHWKKNVDGQGTLKRMEINLIILGDIPVQLIDTVAVRELRHALEEEYIDRNGKLKYRASSTVNRHMAHLKTVLNDCRKLGHIKRLPEIVITNERDRRRTRYITKDEKKALMAYFKIPLQREHDSEKRYGLALQIGILFETGMRVGESLKMKYGKHIQLDRKVIVLTADITKAKTTRTIPLTQRAFDILKQRQNEGYTDRPFPWSNYFVNKVWNKAKKAVGIPKEDTEFVPHSIRHTLATNFLGQGVSIAKVQKLLGHRNMSTTDIYNQLVAEDIRDDLEDLSGSMND
jgi:integrase